MRKSCQVGEENGFTCHCSCQQQLDKYNEEELDAGDVITQPLEVEDGVGELQQPGGLRDDQLVRVGHWHLVLTNQNI